MKTISYAQHNRFAKQLKKLSSKYHSLPQDLKNAQIAAVALHHIHQQDNHAIELIPKFDLKIIQIYKIRKFACQALKGKGVKSGIRIIYGFYPENFSVEFLEIFYKEKASSDMDYPFIKNYIKKNSASKPI
ncbi:MAG: hypothetical protein HON23_02470 [Rickettsiales bacterium]|jgi:hypothetical protein|nr:hypothetical protein [Rickettsiales bacterium]